MKRGFGSIIGWGLLVPEAKRQQGWSAGKNKRGDTASHPTIGPCAKPPNNLLVATAE
jgi:hypothetical protein